jgi:hypothetical protein
LKEKTYNAFKRIESFSELCTFLASNPPVFRVAYSWPGDVERDDDFERVCRAVYACKFLTFGVDECDQFMGPNFLPRHLDMLVSLGRHRDLSFIGASRRPKEIHPLIRAQASEIHSFQQTEPLDLDWCYQVMGEQTERLPTLPPFYALVWRDGDASKKTLDKTAESEVVSESDGDRSQEVDCPPIPPPDPAPTKQEV